MEMSKGVSLLRTAQSLLTGRTIPQAEVGIINFRFGQWTGLKGVPSHGNATSAKASVRYVMIGMKNYDLL